MRRFILIVSLTLGFSTISSSCYAADADHKQSVKSVQASPATSLDSQRTQEELAVLRARLEAEREHNSAVLQTVYWSLGVLATIAAALIGFGWLVNFRVYERDKEQLQRTLLDGLDKAAVDTKAALERLSDELTKQNAESLNQIRDESLDRVLKAVDEKTGALKHLIAQGEKSAKQLRLDHELFRAEYLFEKKQHGLGFSSSLNAVVLAQSLGQAWAADNIIGDLEKQIRKMDGMFGSDIVTISGFLENLDGISDIQRDRLIEALKHVKRL